MYKHQNKLKLGLAHGEVVHEKCTIIELQSTVQHRAYIEPISSQHQPGIGGVSYILFLIIQVFNGSTGDPKQSE